MIFCLLLLVNDSTGFAFKPASVRFSSPTYQPLIPIVVADGQVSWKEASELAESTKFLTAKRGGAASLAVLSAPWLIENDNLVLWLAVTGAAYFLLSREERLDPGSAQSCAAWFGGERGSLLYDKDGVSVTEVDALDELGGQWRCLRTAKGQVVQSALRVVQGSLHPGALSGYTRALGAAALACSSLANHQTCRVLNLGLGGGTVRTARPAKQHLRACSQVVNFLCAHAGATVVAVDYSKAVVAATRATMPPLEGLVDIVRSLRSHSCHCSASRGS